MSNVLQHVWVVDSQPDHAALQREALELAFPQLRVETFTTLPADREIRPDVIVIDQAGQDLDQRSLQPNGESGQSLIWVARNGRAPSPGNAVTLDKQDGGMFFEALIAAVAHALDASSATSHVGLLLVEPESDDVLARPAAIASLLAAARHSLDDLYRVHQLIAHRFDPEQMEGRLSQAQEVALRRTRGALTRLDALLESSRETRVESLPLDSWLALRSNTWPVFLGSSAPELTINTDGGPCVRLVPLVLGHLLDDLLLWFARHAAGAPRLSTSVCYLDQDYLARHPGATAGRYACLELRARQPLATRSPSPTLTHSAIALMRGHGGYAEIEAGRIALMLPLAVPSLAVPVRPRVLIGAADGDWVLAITSALRSSGIDVATCSSSAAAESLLAAGCRYRAVLFDLDEAHSAAGIVQRLRAADPHVHCICVTPNLRIETLRDLMSAGALGYCPRWLSPTIVSSWLCPVLGLPR